MLNGDIIAGKSTTPSPTLSCVSSTEAELCAMSFAYLIVIKTFSLLKQIYKGNLQVYIVTERKKMCWFIHVVQIGLKLVN